MDKGTAAIFCHEIFYLFMFCLNELGFAIRMSFFVVMKSKKLHTARGAWLASDRERSRRMRLNQIFVIWQKVSSRISSKSR